jgi:hypothetical protein
MVRFLSVILHNTFWLQVVYRKFVVHISYTDVLEKFLIASEKSQNNDLSPQSNDFLLWTGISDLPINQSYNYKKYSNVPE